jgi:hypothetical protein
MWLEAKAITVDTVHIMIYYQMVTSNPLLSNSYISERAGPQSTAQPRDRLSTLKNDRSNTGIEVKSRATAALANCESGDVWRCSRLLVMVMRQRAQLIIGGTVARACADDVPAVPMHTCVGASTWRRTVNTREYLMRLPRRTLRMAWTLRATLKGGPPKA